MEENLIVLDSLSMQLQDKAVGYVTIHSTSSLGMFTTFLWLLIYLFGALHRFQHCTYHITTGSWKGRGNSTLSVKVLYCKLPYNGKQLLAFTLEVGPGSEPQSQRWEVRVLPLCQCGPPHWLLNPI